MAGAGSNGPTMKKIKLEAPAEVYLLELLSDINRTLSERLDEIESRLAAVESRCSGFERKINSCIEHLKSSYEQQQLSASNDGISDVGNAMSRPRQVDKASPYPSVETSDGAIVVAIPREKRTPGETVTDLTLWDDNLEHGVQHVGSNVACSLIKLNSEDDYPHGSWLGDEENPNMRVRVNISSSDLVQLQSTHRTPEKMALALLDFLFDRDTQASSNISGSSKHGKQQLDPLLIYAIRCHLIYHFSITEDDWRRLKLNIDSKCRSAYRRKIRGMPLTVKAFRGKNSPSFTHSEQNQCNQLTVNQPNRLSNQSRALIIRRLPQIAVAKSSSSTETVLPESDNTIVSNGMYGISIINADCISTDRTNSDLVAMDRVVYNGSDVGAEVYRTSGDENYMYGIDTSGDSILTNSEVLTCESGETVIQNVRDQYGAEDHVATNIVLREMMSHEQI